MLHCRIHSYNYESSTEIKKGKEANGSQLLGTQQTYKKKPNCIQMPLECERLPSLIRIRNFFNDIRVAQTLHISRSTFFAT